MDNITLSSNIMGIDRFTSSLTVAPPPPIAVSPAEQLLNFDKFVEEGVTSSLSALTGVYIERNKDVLDGGFI